MPTVASVVKPPCLSSSRIGASAVMTVMSGHVTEAATTTELAEFRGFIASMDPPTWLIDATTLSGFEPRAVQGGAAWFRAFRERNGVNILMVSALGPARMVASTLGFGAGVKVRHFETVPAALDHLGLRPLTPAR